jgi:hypothetical protein
MEHTPKNILLRSVLRTGRTSDSVARKAMVEVVRMRSLLNVPPLTLEQTLRTENRLPFDSETANSETAESSNEACEPVGGAVASGGPADRSSSPS